MLTVLILKVHYGCLLEMHINRFDKWYWMAHVSCMLYSMVSCEWDVMFYNTCVRPVKTNLCCLVLDSMWSLYHCMKKSSLGILWHFSICVPQNKARHGFGMTQRWVNYARISCCCFLGKKSYNLANQGSKRGFSTWYLWRTIFWIFKKPSSDQLFSKEKFLKCPNYEFLKNYLSCSV